jgi:hypothetical protein
MKKWILAAAACAATQGHAADDARTAVDKAWQQFQQGVQSEQELVEVNVVQGGQPLPAKLLWRRVRYGERGQRLSIKFVEPTADLGLGLLVERNLSGGDQIWLRQPSWTNARKISGNRETKYFADTAFTFEDTKQLVGEQTDLFEYRYVSQSAAGAVIAATPKPGTISGYGRRDISLNAQGVPVRTDYFDGAGLPLKTLSFEELSYPAPGRWRADRIVLKQTRDGGQSILKVRKRSFNMALSERMFSLPYLLENDSAKAE